MFDGSFGSSVRGVVACKGSEQRSHYSDQLAAFLNINCSSFQDKESSFGVDSKIICLATYSFEGRQPFGKNLRKHLIIFLLRHFSDRLFQHLPDRVHDNINLTEVLEHIGEQFVDRSSSG
jgi:hypothetical protein